MNSEAQIIISFIFNRSGKLELKESEIYLPLSLELSWFTTNESRNFVNYCIQKKLLIKNKDLLSPGFDIEKITMPFGFHPKKKEYVIEKTEMGSENIVETVIQQIIQNAGKSYNDVSEEIKQIELEKEIVPEVAVLLVAQKYDIDVGDYFDTIESLIFTENEL